MENQFSKIILGTVQLGMPYGVGRWANELMPEAEAFRILDAAWEMGITTLDTSPDYGLAEMRVAKYMKANPAKCFHIISKIKNIPLGKNYISKVFNRWHADCPFNGLDNCSSISILLHREHDICRQEISEHLNRMVYSGQVSRWGVSVYDERYARIAASVDQCSVVQLPFSALNQSFGRSGTIELASSSGKIVLARSVFLQGLINSARHDFNASGSEKLRFIDSLLKSVKSVEPDLNDFCIKIALQESGVSNLVIGADTPEHVKAWIGAIDASNSKPISEKLLRQLRNFRDDALNPAKWKNRSIN